jgi:hypothetical protein
MGNKLIIGVPGDLQRTWPIHIPEVLGPAYKTQNTSRSQVGGSADASKHTKTQAGGGV